MGYIVKNKEHSKCRDVLCVQIDYFDMFILWNTSSRIGSVTGELNTVLRMKRVYAIDEVFESV